MEGEYLVPAVAKISGPAQASVGPLVNRKVFVKLASGNSCQLPNNRNYSVYTIVFVCKPNKLFVLWNLFANF